MRGRRPEGARLRSLGGLSGRSLRARPLRSVLTTAAIVLGVGMVFGVLLLVGTISGTFDRLYDSIYGKTDVVVSGERSVGSLPAGTIDEVRAVRGVESASGSIYSVFRTVDERGRVETGTEAQIYVVGIDPTQPDTSTARHVAGREVRTGAEIEVPADWAQENGVALGDELRVSTPSGLAALEVVGFFEFEGGLELGGYGTGAMPIDTARTLMGKPDVWDEITVVAEEGASPEALRTRIDGALDEGVQVALPATKGDEAEDQLAAFNVVLSFFSGIALFVGAFLILNSFNMTVLQRMREIGTLRALGAGQARIAGLILREAALLGVVGSVLGLGVGVGLALLLVQAMQAFGLPVAGVDLAAGPAVTAVVVGMIATLAGAAWPALRAGRISPIRALVGDRGVRRAPRRTRALVGFGLLLPGMLVSGFFWFGNRTDDSALAAVGGIGATMALFLGLVLLAPFVVLPIAELLGRGLQSAAPAEGRLAVDALRSNPGRTAATAATLLVALSVVVVNSTVASSVVGSIGDEIDRQFARDVTVQPVGYDDYTGFGTGLPRDLEREIAALPETGAVSPRRVLFLPELPEGGQEGIVVGYDPESWAQVDDPRFIGATTEEALAGMAAGGVVPAESYASSVGLEVGDRLTLEGPSGAVEAPVVAIGDTLDAGGQLIQTSLTTMEEVYGATTDQQLAVVARSPDARDALGARIDALLQEEHPGLEALSTGELKAEYEAQIDEQFAMFNAMVGIAVLVGMLGIVNTLSMSVLERTREIGVLRALGASRWRVRRMLGHESLLVSIAGTVAGLLAGLGIAFVWIVGMRETTFPGLTFHLPTGMLVTIAVLGAVIGVLAAILPARRAARLDPLSALRYE